MTKKQEHQTISLKAEEKAEALKQSEQAIGERNLTGYYRFLINQNKTK